MRGEDVGLPATEATPLLVSEPEALTKQATAETTPMATIAAPAPRLEDLRPQTSGASRQHKSARTGWIIAGGGIIIAAVMLYLDSRGSNTNPVSNSNSTRTINSANNRNTITSNTGTITSQTGNTAASGNTNTSPPPRPSAADLIGTVWEATITREGLKPWIVTFEFLSKDKVKLTHERNGKSQPGSWSLKGYVVNIDIRETYDYAGHPLNLTIKGDEMTGAYTWYGGWTDNYVLRKVK
jgi:hypothetical protein